MTISGDRSQPWPVYDAKARFSELLDTNVISEFRRNRPHGAVLAWRRSIPTHQVAIPADGPVFREWARLLHGKSQDLSADAMIAATARIRSMVVVSRNVQDFALFDVPVLDPFTGRLYPPER